MTEQQPEDPKVELDRLESELDELDRNVREVRDSITDAGPMDPEERGAALQQIEELSRIRRPLEERRDTLRGRLGTAGG